MCTAEERIALHAVACPWCGAGPREECTVREADVKHTKGTRRYQPRRITTLDGNAHAARWQAALGHDPSVIVAALPAPTKRVPELVTVGERPW